MRFHKLISVILHPVVMPTIGVLLYFLITPYQIPQKQQYVILAITFLATYIIPVLLLVLLKSIGLISSFQVGSIKERKVPLILMFLIFFFLGRVFNTITSIHDLSFLFYGTASSLFVVYVLFIFKLKSSLHLLSFGNAIAFFLLFSLDNAIYILPIVAVLILLAGLLGSSRLHLKAHTTIEVYLGFFIGFLCQFGSYYFL